MRSSMVGVVDFPTLGDLIDACITRHCQIPDGWKRKEPFVQYDWQFWCTANHYRVRGDATFDPADPPRNHRTLRWYGDGRGVGLCAAHADHCGLLLGV